MKIIRRKQRCAVQKNRGGVATLEVVLTLGTVFIFTVALYKMAVVSCHNLFQVVGSMVGSPYL